MTGDKEQIVALKRSLTLPMVVFYGLGNILGAGIYVLVGKVAGEAGLLAPLSFLVAALVASASAFSYGELSSRYPVSAGEAVFVQRGFGIKELSILVGILISLSGMVSSAAIAKGFVGYLQVFITVPDWLAIVLLLLMLGTLAGWGINQSVRVASFITVAEIFGLLLIIGVGGSQLTTLPHVLPEMVAMAGDATVWGGVMLGGFLAFYAFLGFEDMANIAEEVKHPRKTLPRAMIIAFIAATFLYVGVTLVAILAVSPQELATSKAPLALIYETTTGRRPILISVIGVFAVINGALIQIIMVSRVIYGMSRQGWIPAGFGRLHPATRTPLIATLLVTFSVMAMALWFPLTALAGITSFLILIIFGLVNISLIRIKRRSPHPEGVTVFPVWIPYVGAVLSFGLIVVSAFFGI